MATFSTEEREKMLSIVERLTNQNVSVIFVSHNVDDILKISNRIVFIREGCIIGEKTSTEGSFSKNDVIGNIIDNSSFNRYPHIPRHSARVIFKAEEICNDTDTVTDCSLFIKKGEIVGIAGSCESIKTSLSKLITGVEVPANGQILLDNFDITGKPVSYFVRKGIVYFGKNVSDNLVMEMDIKFNISLTKLYQRFLGFFVSRSDIRKITEYFIDRMNIQNISHDSKVSSASRGTQQKIALAKWLRGDSRIIVFNQPTETLDSKSKVDFYNILEKLTDMGKSILLVSSDLSELMGMCDRIYVMNDHTIVDELCREDWIEDDAMLYIAGM